MCLLVTLKIKGCNFSVNVTVLKLKVYFLKMGPHNLGINQPSPEKCVQTDGMSVSGPPLALRTQSMTELISSHPVRLGEGRQAQNLQKRRGEKKRLEPSADAYSPTPKAHLQGDSRSWDILCVNLAALSLPRKILSLKRRNNQQGTSI